MLNIFSKYSKKIFLRSRFIKHSSSTALLLILIFLVFGCGSRQQQDSQEITKTNNDKIQVSVSILPQKYFVERIGGDKAAINVMIPPGHNHAVYEPSPQQMKTLSRSNIYFRIGYIVFEQAWMENFKAINRNMRIVDTSKGVRLIQGSCDHEPVKHRAEQIQRDKEKIDDHTGIDPHIWLSPQAVKIQAKNILDAFLEFDPANKIFYENNYKTFAADIDRLIARMTTIFKDHKGKKFMIFHPALTYLARDFGLVQYAIEMEGKDPNPADLKKIIDIARKEGIRVVFIQQQFSTHTAAAVADEINGEVVFLDPLAPNWLSNMKKISEMLKEAL